ncbi:hypothetical protein TNCV_3673801 [Trichonephila clavipes]|nr:hypothetical protein TNCV_3673801 [Trichonephila clavipes]
MRLEETDVANRKSPIKRLKLLPINKIVLKNPSPSSPQKDGSPQVCIDFRKLNRVLVKDHYSLPLIEDILDKLQDIRVFSPIDLRNGFFFHVPVNKQSRPYTSFVTQNGQFQFLKMPFGLSTCPSTFQRFINTVFRNLVVQGIVLPYMDDIVILAKNESEAIDRLKKFLKCPVITD